MIEIDTLKEQAPMIDAHTVIVKLPRPHPYWFGGEENGSEFIREVLRAFEWHTQEQGDSCTGETEKKGEYLNYAWTDSPGTGSPSALFWDADDIVLISNELSTKPEMFIRMYHEYRIKRGQFTRYIPPQAALTRAGEEV